MCEALPPEPLLRRAVRSMHTFAVNAPFIFPRYCSVVAVNAALGGFSIKRWDFFNLNIGTKYRLLAASVKNVSRWALKVLCVKVY